MFVVVCGVRDEPWKPWHSNPSSLVDAYNEKRRQALRENLYPLLEPLELEIADKVVKMLLKVDKRHVLHLPQSRDALEAKFAEAMELLRNTTEPDDNPVEHQHVGVSKL